jgi:hypothetical protein
VGRGSRRSDADRLPTFFVIGAAKAGTTSLHHYLRAHPQIEMTEPKEPHLFCGPPDFRDRLSVYREVLTGSQPLRGEVSPGYAACPIDAEVPDRIAAVVPGARLVYLVRDPVERAIAQYAEHVIQRAEVRPISEALDLDDPRCPYLAASRYATQVESYLRRFEPGRLLVVDSAELRDRRSSALASIFAHVGADPDFWDASFEREHYARARENTRRPRAELAIQRSGTYRRLLRPLVPARVRGRVRTGIRRALAQPIDPDPSPELREQLAAALAPEADRLRALTGQRFPSWSV